MNMPIKTIIADDDPLARDNVEVLLRDEPDFEVVARCVDGPSALEAVRTLHPDLVFLDVEMPGIPGNVLAQQWDHAKASVIFVTAHDRFAVEAFTLGAVDYLCKPFSRARFTAALSKAKARAATKRETFLPSMATTGAKGDEPLPASNAESWKGRMLFRCDGEIHVISPADILWIKAEGDYVRLHTADRGRLIRTALTRVLSRLDATHFVRIHRSVVINLHHVKKLMTAPYGEYMVEMHNGARLKVSRTYVPELRGLF